MQCSSLTSRSSTSTCSSVIYIWHAFGIETPWLFHHSISCCINACRPRSNPHSLSNRFRFSLGNYGSSLITLRFQLDTQTLPGSVANGNLYMLYKKKPWASSSPSLVGPRVMVTKRPRALQVFLVLEVVTLHHRVHHPRDHPETSKGSAFLRRYCTGTMCVFLVVMAS